MPRRRISTPLSFVGQHLAGKGVDLTVVFKAVPVEFHIVMGDRLTQIRFRMQTCHLVSCDTRISQGSFFRFLPGQQGVSGRRCRSGGIVRLGRCC